MTACRRPRHRILAICAAFGLLTLGGCSGESADTAESSDWLLVVFQGQDNLDDAEAAASLVHVRDTRPRQRRPDFDAQTVLYQRHGDTEYQVALAINGRRDDMGDYCNPIITKALAQSVTGVTCDVAGYDQRLAEGSILRAVPAEPPEEQDRGVEDPGARLDALERELDEKLDELEALENEMAARRDNMAEEIACQTRRHELAERTTGLDDETLQSVRAIHAADPDHVARVERCREVGVALGP